MRSLAGGLVFDVDGRPYRWEQVIAGAIVDGGWDALEGEARAGLALAARWSPPRQQV